MPNTKWAILIAFAAAWLGYAPAVKAVELSQMESDLLSRTFKCDIHDGTCVVRDNIGGDNEEFGAAAKMLYLKRIRLVCDGACYSANGPAFDRMLYAVRFAAKESGVPIDEKMVCVTQRARFGLHETYTLKDARKGRTLQNAKFGHMFFLNKDIQAWVDAKGPLLNRNLPDHIRKSGPSSPEWRAWVEVYGALPKTLKESEYLVMDFEQAKAFWPACESTQVVTR
jgi:hypothetical protein